MHYTSRSESGINRFNSRSNFLHEHIPLVHRCRDLLDPVLIVSLHVLPLPCELLIVNNGKLWCIVLSLILFSIIFNCLDLFICIPHGRLSIFTNQSDFGKELILILLISQFCRDKGGTSTLKQVTTPFIICLINNSGRLFIWGVCWFNEGLCHPLLSSVILIIVSVLTLR